MASKSVMAMLDEVATAHGLDPGLFRAFAGIESTFKPGAVTGSYKGLFQLSDEVFKKHGAKGGNILNARDNAEAAARSFNSNIRSFRRRVGRDPTPNELYLSHQQGKAGVAAHAKNPQGVAWKNIRPYYTDAAAKKKGYKNGDAYAKAAVWDNLPAQAKQQFGAPENVTSEDFTKWWEGRVSRGLRKHGYNPEVGSSPYAAPGPDTFKNQARLPQQTDFTPKALAQGIKTSVKDVFQKAKPLSSEMNDRAFGKPFGDLYKNQLSLGGIQEAPTDTTIAKSVPPKVPLFREIFSSLFNK